MNRNTVRISLLCRSYVIWDFLAYPFLFFSRPRKNMSEPPDPFDWRTQTFWDIWAFFGKSVCNFEKRIIHSSLYFISYTCMWNLSQVIHCKYDILKMTKISIVFFAMLPLVFLYKSFRKKCVSMISLTIPKIKKFRQSVQGLETKL